MSLGELKPSRIIGQPDLNGGPLLDPLLPRLVGGEVAEVSGLDRQTTDAVAVIAPDLDKQASLVGGPGSLGLKVSYLTLL